jgi:hypothetical protein
MDQALPLVADRSPRGHLMKDRLEGHEIGVSAAGWCRGDSSTPLPWIEQRNLFPAP